MSAVAGATPPPVALSTMWAVQPRFERDLPAFLERARELGYGAVEINHSMDAAQAGAILGSGLLPVSAVHAPAPLDREPGRGENRALDLASADEAERGAAVRHAIRSIGLAAEAGAGSADVNPYPLEDLIGLLCEQARTNGGRPARPPLWLDPWPRLRFLDGAQAARIRRRRRNRVERVRALLERVGASVKARRLRVLELQMGFHDETFRQYLPFILENRYIFEAGNIRDTYAGLSVADRAALPWDPESIDWPTYWIECQIRGIREWVQPEAVREWTFKL